MSGSEEENYARNRARMTKLEDRCARIRDLNDRFRRDHHGGFTMVTPEIQALGAAACAIILQAVSEFDEFTVENDPYLNMAHPAQTASPLVTPDGRYLVVRGRLWRTANPHLSDEVRERLVHELMDARRRVGLAKSRNDFDTEAAARADVDAAKRALGERGPVWWDDGAPDLNRHLARTGPYSSWFAGMERESGE